MEILGYYSNHTACTAYIIIEIANVCGAIPKYEPSESSNKNYNSVVYMTSRTNEAAQYPALTFKNRTSHT